VTSDVLWAAAAPSFDVLDADLQHPGILVIGDIEALRFFESERISLEELRRFQTHGAPSLGEFQPPGFAGIRSRLNTYYLTSFIKEKYCVGCLFEAKCLHRGGIKRDEAARPDGRSRS